MAKQPNLVQIGSVVQLGIGGHKVTNSSTDVKLTAADGTTLAKLKLADAVASNEAYTMGQATTAFSAYSNVDNTSDANKPVSTATQTALNLKANAADLTNVDNTSDADKPVSTAQQTEIDTKEDAVTWGNGLANSGGTATVDLASSTIDYDEFTITGGTFNGSTFIKNGTASIDDSTPDSSTSITTGTYAFFYKQGETNKCFIYNTDANQYYYIALSSGDFSGTIPSDLDNLVAYFSNSSLSTTTYDGHTAPEDEGTTLGGGQLDYAGSGAAGFLEFDSGKLKVSTEAVSSGSSDKVPTSSSVKTALDAKEPTITAGTSSQYWRGDKSWQTLNAGTVGLENCDNTSDANKPVSTATQTALDLKANDNAVIKKDGSVAFTGAVDAGSNKVTNVTDGTADDDAATVGQMNSAIATNSVIDFQNTVAVVTSLDSYTYANGTSGVGATITANANGAWDSADSDGVSLSVGDAVTIPSTAITSGLSNASEAGIYTVTSVGGAVSTWVFTRAVPSDQSVEWLKGRICRVNAGGSTYGSKFYQFQGTSNPTIGTDALTLVQVGDVSLGANSVGETELNLGDGLVDADSFVLSSAYSQGSADTLPAAGDTAEEAVEKLAGIVDVSGYSPENYTAADDTLAAHVEGIDAELEGWNKVFMKTLTHTDGSVLIKTAPSGSTIMEVEFIVNTAFNGTDPNLTIGTPADNDKYVVTTDVDLATQDSARDVATVKVRETFSAGTAINAYLTPDGSTTGSVDVFVRLRK